MISMIVPLAIGNALRVIFVPVAGTVLTRVLRKQSATFNGPDDPEAALVADTVGSAVLDIDDALVNGQMYFYCTYYFNGSAWSAGSAMSAVPQASYFDRTVDVQTLVRRRVAAGMKIEIARGSFKPATGKMDVLTAPPLFDQKRLPMVTVHLENESPVQRTMGDSMGDDDVDSLTGSYESAQGWFGKTQLTVVCWSLNPDERLALRRALRRVLVANLPVFVESGMQSVEFSMNDMADFQSFGIPVYQAVCTFTCLSPVSVAHSGDPITGVEVTGYPVEELVSL